MNVKVYSTPFCSYCVTLKAFLEKHSIEFQNIDVSVDKEAAQEMIRKTEQTGVPVVEIDDQIVIGFNREKISELLNIKE